MSKVTAKIIHYGLDYATVEFHKSTSNGGKTLMYDVPLAVAEWIEE